MLIFFFISGLVRMELLLNNASLQVYILHSSGHIQVNAFLTMHLKVLPFIVYLYPLLRPCSKNNEES